LKLPVLIMMGADDPIVPVVNGRILASRLPDARLEVIDCGHLFILTHPDQTARTIERFLCEAPETEPADNRDGRADGDHRRGTTRCSRHHDANSLA
jgi:surfactin synthase thioesterase subunit